MMDYYRFGPWRIWYDPPPIPTRACDWHYAHDDYDGAPIYSDGPPADNRCGSAASVQDCVAEIIAEFVDEQCYDCPCSATDLAGCMSTDCPFRFKLETPLDRYAADMVAVLKPFQEIEAVFERAFERAAQPAGKSGETA